MLKVEISLGESARSSETTAETLPHFHPQELQIFRETSQFCSPCQSPQPLQRGLLVS